MISLTIIIPYYKIDFFKETLQSLQNQTCKDFNVFIGDDASPNDPQNVITETLQDVHYTYKKYDENIGGRDLVKQWERVLHDAQPQEWFQILGDDDIISENFVEEFFKATKEITQKKSQVVKFSQRFINEKNEALNESTDYERFVSPKDNFNNKLAYGHRSSLSEYIFSIKSYKKFGFVNLPLAWGTDDIAVFEFSDNRPIVFIKEANVLIRISKVNISGNTTHNVLKDEASILKEEYVINKYFNILDHSYMLMRADNHIKYAYAHKRTPQLDFLKIYKHCNQLGKFLKHPFKIYQLKKYLKR